MSRFTWSAVVVSLVLLHAPSARGQAEPTDDEAPSHLNRPTEPHDPSVSEDPARSMKPSGSLTKKKAKKKKKKRRRRGRKTEPVHLALRARLGAGAMAGRITRRLESPVLEAGLDTELDLRFGDFQLEIPIDAEQSWPVAVSLRESRARMGFDLTYRPMRELRPSVGARLSGVYRPGWPDQYQPLSDGSLVRTNRFSYVKREGRLGLATIPFRHHHARLKYSYAVRQYLRDPTFDPIGRPNHLTPADTTEHVLTPSWRLFFGSGNVNAEVGLYSRRYLFEFSRDRGTGQTHAGAGGPPPNPLQRFLGVVPELTLKWELSAVLTVRPKLRLTLNRDTYQGYYSYWEPYAGAAVRFQARRDLELELEVEAWVRRYTDAGYQTSAGHPPLDDGYVRRDRRLDLRLSAAQTLTDRLGLELEGKLRLRNTNFPDYVAAEFPAGAQYDIPWDYTNARVLLFVTYELN